MRKIIKFFLSFFRKKEQIIEEKKEQKTEVEKPMTEIESRTETAQEALDNLRKIAKVSPGTYRAIVYPVGRDNEQIIYEIKDKDRGMIIGTVRAAGFLHLEEAIQAFEAANNLNLIYDYHGKYCDSNFENKTIKPDCKCKKCEEEVK